MNEVIREHPAFANRDSTKMMRWASEGSKYAAYARGGWSLLYHLTIFTEILTSGSFYILFIIALAGQKTLAGRLPGDLLRQFLRHLRRPDEKEPEGRMVLRSIIPAIALLRKTRILFSTMFSHQIRQPFSLDSSIDASDIQATDKFYSLFSFRVPFYGRCKESWHSCFEILDSSSPVYSLFVGNSKLLNASIPLPSNSASAMPCSSLANFRSPSPLTDTEEDDISLAPTTSAAIVIPHLITISTNYDKNLQSNRIKISENDTPLERSRAASAYVPKNLVDFTKKVTTTLYCFHHN